MKTYTTLDQTFTYETTDSSATLVHNGWTLELRSLDDGQTQRVLTDPDGATVLDDTGHIPILRPAILSIESITALMTVLSANGYGPGFASDGHYTEVL